MTLNPIKPIEALALILTQEFPASIEHEALKQTFKDLQTELTDLRTRLEASEAKGIVKDEALQYAYENSLTPAVHSKITAALSPTCGNSVLEELKELRKDNELLDKLEKEVTSSGYHVELRGCSIPQSNGVVVKLRCGSGPFHRQIDGQAGNNPLRMALRTALDAAKEGV